MPRFSRAFTLIELLVVISIIGILATVILVALNGARQKGVLGAAQEFDKSAYAGWYSDTTAAWDFDEGSTGGVVPDQSGNNNNLTLTNATLVSNPNPFPGGSVIAVDAASNKTAQSNAMTVYPTTFPTSGGDFSVSFWLNTTGFDAFNFVSNNYAAAGSWRFAPHTTGGSIFFDVKSETNSAANISSPILIANQWYQIVGVCSNTSGKTSLYINGVQVTSGTISGGCGYNANTVRIDGQNIAAGTIYPYYVDNVRIYKKALPISVIQEQYFVELPKHLSLATRSEQ